MVTTTTEILSVNGVVLNTLAKNVESIAGRLRAAAFRTGNVTVPGRDGDLWVPNKKFQSNQITLPMWVVGSDDDGAIPNGSSARIEFFKRVDELVTLFKSPALLDVRHTLPDGSIRQYFAEALDVLDFTTDASPKGMVGVVLEVPGSFWQDVTALTQQWTGTVGTATPSNFAGTQVAITDPIWELTGPWTSPRLTFSDGSFMAYNAVIAATQKLTVNCGTWELTGSGGLTVDYSKIQHDGSDAIWGAVPASLGAITMTGSARTTASKLVLTARRKFLVG